MWREAVGLDRTTGQAYDLIFQPGYGFFSENLYEKTPITYDEVRRKAQIAHDMGIAGHAVLIVDPSGYDSLSEETWCQFVQDPPSRVLHSSVKEE